MEPVLLAGDEEFASAATGGDDYVIIFLCTLGAFYAAVELLNKSVVIAFLRHLWNCSTPVRSGFCFLCFLVGVGWIALMETIVQKLVPVYFITSWGIIASFTFLSLAIGGLRLFVRNAAVTAHLSAALGVIVLPVEMVHYYLVGGFRRCVPLPVLYALAPLVLILYIRKHLYRLGLFCGMKPPIDLCPPIEPCACPSIDSYPTEESTSSDTGCIDDGTWAAEFEAYRKLGRSELQRLENLALCIDPDFGRYDWDAKSVMQYSRQCNKCH